MFSAPCIVIMISYFGVRSWCIVKKGIECRPVADRTAARSGKERYPKSEERR